VKVNLHPNEDPHYLRKVCAVLPQPLAGFVAALASVSSSVWQEGGLLIEEVSDEAPASINFVPSSPLPLVQEFFCCVYGNQSQERVFESAQVVENYLSAIALALPESKTHMHVEVEEGSWCYRLHTVVERNGQAVLYVRLFWSVD